MSDTKMKQKDWQSKKFKVAVELLLKEKPIEKSLSKAAEELNELAVRLLQYINKPKSIKPGDIEEEIADVEQHLVVLKRHFPVSKTLRDEKINKFLNSDDYKFYKQQNKKKK